MTTSIWWARRDLRLAYNEALQAALNSGEHVVPVFILDPELLSAPDAGEKRVAFLLEGLRALDSDLRERDSRLIVRRGDPLAELTRLQRETGASTIYAEADPWPYARRRDARVAEELPLELTEGLMIHPPGSILKNDGDPYVVFTPFRRKWEATPSGALPQDELLDTVPTPEDVTGIAIPREPTNTPDVPFPAGETEARRRLRDFAAGEGAPIYRYADARNDLAADDTSHLSPYLRFGMLSTAEVVTVSRRAIAAAPDATSREGAKVWLSELVWREFFQHVLYHFPEVLERSFRTNLQGIEWANNEKDFAAWQQGRTGYPVVDAAMRRLRQTGWMHNRARMIVGSFLTKDLLIDWRWGERHFMQHLVDGDPASNNGGWQWVAGTGTDAAPYFRIFNPVLQGKKHDPTGGYVRRWIDELTGVPDERIHEPWKMAEATQRKVGCRIGIDYPAPLVDHDWARDRTLSAYALGRQRAEQT